MREYPARRDRASGVILTRPPRRAAACDDERQPVSLKLRMGLINKRPSERHEPRAARRRPLVRPRRIALSGSLTDGALHQIKALRLARCPRTPRRKCSSAPFANRRTAPRRAHRGRISRSRYAKILGETACSRTKSRLFRIPCSDAGSCRELGCSTNDLEWSFGYVSEVAKPREPESPPASIIQPIFAHSSELMSSCDKLILRIDFGVRVARAHALAVSVPTTAIGHCVDACHADRHVAVDLGHAHTSPVQCPLGDLVAGRWPEAHSLRPVPCIRWPTPFGARHRILTV